MAHIINIIHYICSQIATRSRISNLQINTAMRTEKPAGKCDMSFFDCFDGGGWADDPRSANEIADELHDNRINTRQSIEAW